MSRKVYRYLYRAHLVSDNPPGFAEAVDAVQEKSRELFAQGKSLVASMFRYKNMVFVYYESVGEELAPDAFFGAIRDYLLDWPGQDALRKWVLMTPAYYHAEPIDEDDWSRHIDTEKCVARMAFLKPDGITDYVRGHRALINEGAHKGDKFTCIALHENILFQYMEQREVVSNVKRDPDLPSQYYVIDPQNPKESMARFSDWLYPNGDPFAYLWPDGGRFNFIEKIFVIAKE